MSRQDPGEEPPTDSESRSNSEKIARLRSELESNQREVSSLHSTVETLRNELDHLKEDAARESDLSELESRTDAIRRQLDDGADGASRQFQGEKATVVKACEVGETYNRKDLRDFQTVNNQQAKKNVETLVHSPYFELAEMGMGRFTFVGSPDDQQSL